ncbi:MAG: CehA/McbA family metallohydrolase [Phycisphaeraceae bacterium]
MNLAPRLLLLLSVLLFFGCAQTQSTTWYRGNTHTHTVICGHADSPPELVAAWYHDRGYHFVILSEHNHFIDPATVNLPTPTREDFILLPGVELTGKRHVHTTSMNVKAVPPWQFNDKDKTKIVQNHVDETKKLGGEAILNHPNWQTGVSSEHMLPVKGLHLFELFNGHPHVHSHGHDDRHSTEDMWDEMLTAGKLIYGVSSDDAHHFQTIKPDLSNPGRGWVMVNADELTPDAITAAMLQGKFYSSNGVFLATCESGEETYLVEVDTEATQNELAGNPLLRGKSIDQGTEGYRIEFIGPEGKIITTIQGTAALAAVDPDLAYVRAKVTYTRKHPAADGYEEYYAWGQPVFNDGRAHDTHQH